jgi:hypothetical protein
MIQIGRCVHQWNCPDRSVVDRFVYTEKVGGSKPSRDI